MYVICDTTIETKKKKILQFGCFVYMCHQCVFVDLPDVEDGCTSHANGCDGSTGTYEPNLN